MVKLWRKSEQESGLHRHPVQAITRDNFFALSEEERGDLLQDFLIIKNTKASPDFLPQLVALIPALSSATQQTLLQAY
jgi:hypothetical protein